MSICILQTYDFNIAEARLVLAIVVVMLRLLYYFHIVVLVVLQTHPLQSP